MLAEWCAVPEDTLPTLIVGLSHVIWDAIRLSSAFLLPRPLRIYVFQLNSTFVHVERIYHIDSHVVAHRESLCGGRVDVCEVAVRCLTSIPVRGARVVSIRVNEPPPNFGLFVLHMLDDV